MNSDRIVELVQQLPCDARIFDISERGVWLNVHRVTSASIYIRLEDGRAYRTRRSLTRFRDFPDKAAVIAAMNERLAAWRATLSDGFRCSFDDYSKTLDLLP